jgi:4-nitrophenyl phosphatase/NagD protein
MCEKRIGLRGSIEQKNPYLVKRKDWMSTTGKALSDIRCFLMDMDGTIYLGKRLLPGAETWLRLLEANRIPYYFLTNNSSRSRLEYAEKLSGLGLEIPPEKIFTSGEATALHLQQKAPGARLYVLGTPALCQAFERHGFQLSDEDPDYAVLGFDTTLTYDKLWRFCDFVVDGKSYIATHPDINCPTETGFKPDIGAMIELIAASTGRRPDVIVGKPNAPMVSVLAQKTGFAVEDHCMIGDRLYTDVAMGQWGIMTALVLSGETKESDLRVSPFSPDLVAADIRELTALLQESLTG